MLHHLELRLELYTSLTSIDRRLSLTEALQRAPTSDVVAVSVGVVVIVSHHPAAPWPCALYSNC